MTRVFRATQAAVVLFAVMTTAAMLLYSGGTYRDRTQEGYSFFTNFLSDLGMARAWDGGANLPSAALFVSAELMIACVLIPFMVALVRHCSATSGRPWARAAMFAGALAVLGILGAAVTPADRMMTLHLQSALLGFRALWAVAVFLAIATIRSGIFTPSAIVSSIVAAVVMTGYVAVLQWGPRAGGSDHGLFVQATSQKIAVITLLTWFYLLSRDCSVFGRSARSTGRSR